RNLYGRESRSPYRKPCGSGARSSPARSAASRCRCCTNAPACCAGRSRAARSRSPGCCARTSCGGGWGTRGASTCARTSCTRARRATPSRGSRDWWKRPRTGGPDDSQAQGRPLPTLLAEEGPQDRPPQEPRHVQEPPRSREAREGRPVLQAPRTRLTFRPRDPARSSGPAPLMKSFGGPMSSTRSIHPFLFLAIALIVFSPRPSLADSKGKGDQVKLVQHAGEGFQCLVSAKDNEVPKALLENAKAVVILPKVYKAAIGIGGRYGKGVV